MTQDLRGLSDRADLGDSMGLQATLVVLLSVHSPFPHRQTFCFLYCGHNNGCIPPASSKISITPSDILLSQSLPLLQSISFTGPPNPGLYFLLLLLTNQILLSCIQLSAYLSKLAAVHLNSDVKKIFVFRPTITRALYIDTYEAKCISAHPQNRE